MVSVPFEYVGGGYFREKGVPVGQPAETLHGDHAIEFVRRLFAAEIERLQTENEQLRAALEISKRERNVGAPRR